MGDFAGVSRKRFSYRSSTITRHAANLKMAAARRRF